MGFAFPKEERDALIQTWPEKFMQPDPGDLRYNWVHVRLDAIDEQELLELVFDADGGAEAARRRVGRRPAARPSRGPVLVRFVSALTLLKALTKWGIVV